MFKLLNSYCFRGSKTTETFSYYLLIHLLSAVLQVLGGHAFVLGRLE